MNEGDSDDEKLYKHSISLLCFFLNHFIVSCIKIVIVLALYREMTDSLTSCDLTKTSVCSQYQNVC